MPWGVQSGWNTSKLGVKVDSVFGPTITSSLSSLCFNNYLKSLNLARILGVPDSLLQDLLLTPNLRELKLSSISISRSTIPDTSLLTPVDLRDNGLCISSMIERLEVTGLRFKHFLDIMKSPIQSSSPYTIPLPHLHTLTLPVPTTSWELDDLWEFLLQVSSSLETLQLQHFQWARKWLLKCMFLSLVDVFAI